jgi:hypothetical protein
MQIGLPADVCYQYFFGAYEVCRGIVDKDSNLHNALVIISDVAVVSGLGLAGFFLYRKARCSVQKTR